MSVPTHTQWLKKSSDELKTIDGKAIEVWEFNHVDDNAILSDWAKHFRNHYCDDSKIDRFRRGTGLSRAEYLNERKFPDEKKYPGPLIRSGDFSEILLMDFFQYLQGYFVPRTRYNDKDRRNSSPQGSDIIALKKNPLVLFDKDDELFVIESKAKLTKTITEDDNPLQKAINDSTKKEDLRISESLAATKERYINAGNDAAADIVERFQNKPDHDFIKRYGAATVLTDTAYIKNVLEKSDASDYSSDDVISLYVFHGKNMMDLVSLLYKKAADEA